MKKILCLILCLSPLVTRSAFSQPQPQRIPSPAEVAAAEPKLTRFNLDFPGGTPGELVAAIQKGMGRPVNVVIPTEHITARLPALKMSGVTLPDLFRALTEAGQTVVNRPQRDGSMAPVGLQSGFRTAGVPHDDAVWYFYVQFQGNYAMEPVKVSRFYLLTPYLETGLTVDDITTAIRTAWKIRGEPVIPDLQFHRETKLLIAVGPTSQLSTVDDVLRALDAGKPKPPAPAAVIPKP